MTDPTPSTTDERTERMARLLRDIADGWETNPRLAARRFLEGDAEKRPAEPEREH